MPERFIWLLFKAIAAYFPTLWGDLRADGDLDAELSDIALSGLFCNAMFVYLPTRIGL
jgi:hypothetical protein